MTDQVSIVVTSRPGELVLRLGGELDIATVGTCRSDLSDAIEERWRRKSPAGSGEADLALVVLDLSGLTFLSVAGLRMLAALAARLGRHHVTTIAAVPPTGLIRRLVHLAGLHRQMSIVDAPYTGASVGTARPPVASAAHRRAAAITGAAPVSAVARRPSAGPEPVRPATLDRVPCPASSAITSAGACG